MTIQDDLNSDEGVKLKPYLDCCGEYWRMCQCKTKGNITIGVGTNLDAGITWQEALILRDNRLSIAREECEKYTWFDSLDQIRKDVIVCMMFNLGAAKFSEFKNMIAALERKDFDSASGEMRSSHWSKEVGKRADRLADAMRTGVMAQ